jgi:anti-anti-sigma regulatory factor/AcrR family transcriptional regulator
VTALDVVGELDIAEQETFDAALADAAAALHDVIVDLTGATYVDVLPFATLVRYDAALRAVGRELVLVADAEGGPVARLIALTRSELQLAVTFEAALRHLAGDDTPVPSLEEPMDPIGDRLGDAVLTAVAADGFERVSVARIVEDADVSREEFYKRFASRSQCFRKALLARMGDQYQRWSDAFVAPGEPLEGPRAALTQYLDLLARQPTVARCYLLENPHRQGALAVRVARRHAVLTDLLQQRLSSRRHDACHAFVAGVPAVAADHVALGRAETLPELVDPLVQTLEPVLAA